MDPLGLDEKEVTAFKFDFKTKKLRVLNQLLLPGAIEYVDVPDCDSGYNVIKSMMVRGAPCIAAVGCLSILAELGHDCQKTQDALPTEFMGWLREKSDKLISARQTAVNLRNALKKLSEHVHSLLNKPGMTLNTITEEISDLCQRAMQAGLEQNRILADHGADEVLKVSKGCRAVSVLTHCNTGALATVGYGTALGVIRSLHRREVLKMVYCTETRPYNQGSRLTAWELVREGVPGTLIADSMVAYLMATSQIDAVLVGADCVASNGDTANKIGTLQLAVLARHYRVPFYVIAPIQSLDLSIDNQSSIRVEQRPAIELKQIGPVKLAPDAINAWNPCFDITPGELITKIVTELGACLPADTKKFVEMSETECRKLSDGLF